MRQIDIEDQLHQEFFRKIEYDGFVNKIFIGAVQNEFDFDALNVPVSTPMESFDEAVAREQAADLFVMTVELEELTETLEFASADMSEEERSELEKKIVHLDEQIRLLQKETGAASTPVNGSIMEAAKQATTPTTGSKSKVTKKSD
jgi:hypothetical protein